MDFPPSPADGSATSMKETELYPQLIAYLGQGFLCFVNIPTAGQNTSILIAIAVTQHHFLNKGYSLLALSLNRRMPEK